jgi:hypothetical protein
LARANAGNDLCGSGAVDPPPAAADSSSLLRGAQKNNLQIGWFAHFWKNSENVHVCCGAPALRIEGKGAEQPLAKWRKI